MEIAFLLTNVKINVKRNTQEEHKQKIHKNVEKVILNTREFRCRAGEP